MVFSSLIFLCIFLPAVFILYDMVPSLKVRNVILMIASLVFYAYGEPVYVLLMIGSSFFNYLFALLVSSGTPGKRKAWLVVSLIMNLGLLCIFKYTGMILSSFNGIFGTSIPDPGIVLPIGISFFTFQALSYVIDVYRGTVKAQKNYLYVQLYIAFFPQLVAGPIVRYSVIAEGIEDRRTTIKDVSEGFSRIILGLGKKVLIANQMGAMWDAILATGQDNGWLGSWVGIIAYTFQIYFDFSGYSDMAIGLGRMFGFTYPENFNLPYIARSITDFWRRWHISMSTFFRDYVYIPLGGNRKRQWLNLLITWFLTGMWHGASWNFILWGLYYCLLLCIEKALGEKRLKHIPKILRHIFTLFFVVLGWMLFYYTDLSQLSVTLAAAFGQRGWARAQSGILFMNNLPLLLVCLVGSTPLPRVLGQKTAAFCVERDHQVLLTLLQFLLILGLLGLATVSLVGESYNPFLYFRF